MFAYRYRTSNADELRLRNISRTTANCDGEFQVLWRARHARFQKDIPRFGSPLARSFFSWGECSIQWRHSRAERHGCPRCFYQGSFRPVLESYDGHETVERLSYTFDECSNTSNHNLHFYTFTRCQSRLLTVELDHSDIRTFWLYCWERKQSKRWWRNHKWYGKNHGKHGVTRKSWYDEVCKWYEGDDGGARVHLLCYVCLKMWRQRTAWISSHDLFVFTAESSASRRESCARG